MTNDERIYRVIDANLNRLKEGLRVVEDIKRYVFDDAKLAYKIKSLRHKAKIPQKEFLKFRNSQNDVLKTSTKSEQERSNLDEIMALVYDYAKGRGLEQIYTKEAISEIFALAR